MYRRVYVKKSNTQNQVHSARFLSKTLKLKNQSSMHPPSHTIWRLDNLSFLRMLTLRFTLLNRYTRNEGIIVFLEFEYSCDACIHPTHSCNNIYDVPVYSHSSSMSFVSPQRKQSQNISSRSKQQTTERSSTENANTETRRRYEAPDELRGRGHGAVLLEVRTELRVCMWQG